MKRLLTIMLMLAAAGCARTVYVPVPTAVRDSIGTVRESRDTLWIRDSVATVTSGDTVRHERLKYIYRTRTLTDTLVRERTDTVTVTVTVPAEADDRRGMMIAIGAAAAAGLMLFLKKL